jgi:hypothetical protein
VTSPKVWGSWQVLYKARQKRNMCWQAMAEALNTIASKVQCKIHNLRNQVTISCVLLHVLYELKVPSVCESDC